MKHSTSNSKPKAASAASYQRLQREILGWYAHHARTFFWREQDAQLIDPYVVLISEVMLQQTQTSRVQEKLPLFLTEFPNIAALAAADNATIIKAWAGMGYNSRALRLRDCARVIQERHGGIIPTLNDELLALPGIGAYTASAVLAFAFHHDVAVLDVNIRRVYSRLLATMPTTRDLADESSIQAFAEKIYPRGESSRWHQAVMDIGALFCTARAPKCMSCPLHEVCPSAGTMQEVRKVKPPEPSWEGTPNRIWRGCIVQILRGLEGDATISSDEILQQLFAGEVGALFENNNAEMTQDAWFLMVLRGLERDGILEITAPRRVGSHASGDTSEVLPHDTLFSCSLRLSKG